MCLVQVGEEKKGDDEKGTEKLFSFVMFMSMSKFPRATRKTEHNKMKCEMIRVSP